MEAAVSFFPLSSSCSILLIQVLTFKKYLKRDIMNTLPICTVTEYSGNLIVLLNARKEADFALAYRQLNSILKHNRLQAGAGRYFHTLTALPYHYTLALESATIAQVHNPGEYQLFQYDDDFLSHVLNRIPAQYCDEGLLSRGYSLLRAFDKEHNTEYAHTLETFIEKMGKYQSDSRSSLCTQKYSASSFTKDQRNCRGYIRS